MYNRFILGFLYISSLLVVVLNAYCAGGYKQSCSTGYTSHSGSGYDYCYYGVSSASISWTDAKSSCSANSGWLVTVHSSDENTLINNFFSCRKWIGFNDIASPGTFVWEYGTSSYTKWASGQPDNGGNEEDCVEQYADGTWNDKECYAQLPCYVCQQIPTCSICPANTYAAAGDSSCTSCPSGKYSLSGSSSCSYYPTAIPTALPTAFPTNIPRYIIIFYTIFLFTSSLIYSVLFSAIPTVTPSVLPSFNPTFMPTIIPR